MISEHPVWIAIVVIAAIILGIAYFFSDDEDDTVDQPSTEKYDIRCTVPGQKELVFQDIPEDDFSFDYDDLVYVERDWKSYYLPIQYTTVLPNE